MNFTELKQYTNRVLGDNFRCLLPSYWWKRLFGLLIDKISEVDAKCSPDTSMSATSSNPVQNKVVKKYIDKLATTQVKTLSYYNYPHNLDPNIYHKVSGSCTTMRFNLNNPTNASIVNNYMMEFTTSSSGCSFSAPSGLKWVNGEVPTLEPGVTYQLSIVNNLAILTKFI